MDRLFSRSLGGCVTVLTALAIGHGAPPPASTVHLDRLLEKQAMSTTVKSIQVIVRAASGSDLSDLKANIRAVGGTVVGEHPIIGAVTARVAPQNLRSLALRPGVESLSSDGVVGADASPTNEWTKRLPGTHLYKALGISDLSLMGDTIGVAVIDTGLVGGTSGTVSKFFDFTRDPKTVKAVGAYDDNGHGTHVAGLIGDSGTQSYGYVGGVAPEVRFIGMKVLDAQGQGRTSDVIRALEYAISNRAALGIDIINLSLGHPIYEPAATDPLVEAVERAVAAGIVVVASAGNWGTNPDTGEVGYAGIVSPGNAPSAITVGATDTLGTDTRTDDRVASFSSRGPTWYDGYAKPDLVAPGRREVLDGHQGQPAVSGLSLQARRLHEPEQLEPGRQEGPLHQSQRLQHGDVSRLRSRGAHAAGAPAGLQAP